MLRALVLTLCCLLFSTGCGGDDPNVDPDQVDSVAPPENGACRKLTPEEVNEDRLKFAETLRTNAKDDFEKLGLELDVLKVQHVADDQQYLQNLGRARIALMIRDAQNAENEANQKIAEEQAAARQRAESAQKKPLDESPMHWGEDGTDCPQ